MDPNETLREIREAVESIRDAETSREAAEWADILADRVEALDEWVSNGGFLPSAWNVMTK